MINVWAGKAAMFTVCLELQRIVPAGALGVLSLFASFAQTSRSRKVWWTVPDVPEAFHARFPVSADETNLPDAREKNLWYPG